MSEPAQICDNNNDIFNQMTLLIAFKMASTCWFLIFSKKVL